jgi:hypothetical protein
MLPLLILLLVYHPTKQLQFQVIPQWHHEPMQLNQPYALGTDTIEIQQWKCYLRVCGLYLNNQIVYSVPSKHYLLDAENKNSLQWQLNIPEKLVFDALECEIGVDSLIQQQGVQHNALDPEHNMYWSWQSGYIHTKLEALSTKTKQPFTFHIGGYRKPYNTLQRFRVKAGSNHIQLHCPVNEWMAFILADSISTIMRPCVEAQKIAASWAGMWYSSQP